MSGVEPNNLAAGDELLDLIASMSDGSISAAGRAKLERRLLEDDRARELYVEYQAVESHLRWKWRATSAAGSVSIASALAAVSRSRHAWAMRAIAASLVLAGCVTGIVALAWMQSGRPRGGVPGVVEPEPVASVIDVAGGTLMIGDQPAVGGQDYRGRRIALDSGTAQFMLGSGTSVELRGSTRLAVHDPMNVAMSQGEAAFDCPPSAVGYTVQLPDGTRVVDLGTRFIVRIDAGADPVVRVVEGHVQIDAPQSPSVSIAAGQRADIAADGPIVSDDPTLLARAFSDDFARGPGERWSRELGGPGSANTVEAADGAVAFRPTANADRYFLRTADAGYHRVDFTASVVIRPGPWPKGAAYIGMGHGEGDPARFGEPFAGPNFLVRVNGPGIETQLTIADGVTGHQRKTATLRPGASHRVTLRWLADPGVMTIEVDVDNDGGEPDFVESFPFRGDFNDAARIYFGGQSDPASAPTAFDDFALTRDDEEPTTTPTPIEPTPTTDGTADQP